MIQSNKGAGSVWDEMLSALSACPAEEAKEIARMSVASNYRRKWGALMKSFDETRGHGHSDDYRMTAAAKAAQAEGLILLEVAAFEALAGRIRELEQALKE